MDYFEIRDSLKTGDILLFRAGTTWAGKAVALISGSPFSHVAMVIRYQGQLCMWESGRDDLKDVSTLKELAGVHLVVLDDILEAYTETWEGDFVVRRLAPTLDADESRYRTLTRWLGSMSGKPFPELWQIVLDQVEARFNPAKFNRQTYACAELIADTFQRVSLLSLDRPAESYSARDFSSSTRISLQFGYELGDEIMVTYSSPPSRTPEGEMASMARSMRTGQRRGLTERSILLP